MVPRFNDVIVGNANAVIWPLHVEMSYSPSELGSMIEGSLRMYYFKNGAWHLCSSTGVNTTAKIVWADMTKAEAAGSPIIIAGPSMAGPTTVGGIIHRVNKIQILMPWLILAAMAILTISGGTGYLVKKCRNIN